MSSQKAKAELFKSMHVKGDPIILFNIWDAGSAKVITDSGAKAVATGSAPVAMANGYADGEQFALDEALVVVSRILTATSLPLTMDLEAGYSSAPEGVGESIEKAMSTGIVGFNFEDQIIGQGSLYSIEDQVARLMAARTAASKNDVHGFVNARTDIFLKAKPDAHTDKMVDEAIERAKAYEEAGADGFFVPGMVNKNQIEKLINAVSLPVNLIVLAHTPSQEEFVDMGAARISYGPTPYLRMNAWLKEQASAALNTD